jgi:phytoene synthase
MISLFHHVSHRCSEITTRQYSTSFSAAIRLLHRDLRQPIYNIYGFVRFADEIVDTFHDYNKEKLLADFKTDTFQAIYSGISLNPILHSFQQTVNQYDIDHSLVEAFFCSMEMDLHRKTYDAKDFDKYIYGSAEVVGLMCLFVFCEGKKDLYDKLKEPARSLGAAFQKVNFLRDIRADFNGLSRIYFPGCDFNDFTEKDKHQIVEDIQNDFKEAYAGIRRLPMKARLGVYVAYKYYFSLFRKISKLKPARILESRIRIPDFYKALIVLRASVKNHMGLL